MTDHLPGSDDVTALFLLRVRVEAGSNPPLRAFMRTTSDVSHGFESSSTLVDVEEAVTMLRRWLRETLEPRAV